MAANSTGTTIGFGTSSFTAENVTISIDGISRESLETSHLGTTTYHTFIPANLSDPGEVSLTFHYNPQVQPPINGAAETVTITYPNGATHAGSGFLTDFSVTADLETILEASATLKMSGAWTFTPAA